MDDCEAAEIRVSTIQVVKPESIRAALRWSPNFSTLGSGYKGVRGYAMIEHDQIARVTHTFWCGQSAVVIQNELAGAISRHLAGKASYNLVAIGACEVTDREKIFQTTGTVGRVIGVRVHYTVIPADLVANIGSYELKLDTD